MRKIASYSCVLIVILKMRVQNYNKKVEKPPIVVTKTGKTSNL